MALIGTTDIPFTGAAGDVAIAPDEVDYLLGVINTYFEKTLSPADVHYAFSGVRPLFDDNADNPSAVTRDYVFEVDAPDGAAPLLSVFGGKITTYRKLSEHALDRLKPFFPKLQPAWTDAAPLPGGDMPNADYRRFLDGLTARYPVLSPALLNDYGRRYGTRVDALLSGVRSAADLGRHFGGRLYEREARFLIEQEWADTAEDILERRTKHGLHLSGAERKSFEAWIASAEAAA
jgi:glycerol-3-phosphate dehydrogenase